jgi:hypothetical protein
VRIRGGGRRERERVRASEIVKNSRKKAKEKLSERRENAR